jgi:bifunctional non-homologous end joining protein LigD
LHGSWHLVRMRRRPGEKRDNWLLIKQTDEAARAAADKDILEERPLSVKTGRTMDEIAQHKRKAAQVKATAKATSRRKSAAQGKRKVKQAKRR